MKQLTPPPTLPPRWCQEQMEKQKNIMCDINSSHELRTNMSNYKPVFVFRSSESFHIAQMLLAVKSNVDDGKVMIARATKILNKIEKLNLCLVETKLNKFANYTEKMKSENEQKENEKEVEMIESEWYKKIKEMSQRTRVNDKIELQKNNELKESFNPKIESNLHTLSHDNLVNSTNRRNVRYNLPEIHSSGISTSSISSISSSATTNQSQYFYHPCVSSNNSTLGFPPINNNHNHNPYYSQGGTAPSNFFQPL